MIENNLPEKLLLASNSLGQSNFSNILNLKMKTRTDFSYLEIFCYLFCSCRIKLIKKRDLKTAGLVTCLNRQITAEAIKSEGGSRCLGHVLLFNCTKSGGNSAQAATSPCHAGHYRLAVPHSKDLIAVRYTIFFSGNGNNTFIVNGHLSGHLNHLIE